MRGKKIEDLTPNHETVMGCLQLALKNLDNANISDTAKISRARHNIRDALRRLGFTQDAVDNPKIKL
ncbi:MAG: hypothetical protein NWE90_02155 [Candidatus Bathyarchaeota archaeon]|nr:hypothetical protein [Candidatus Bathyarchaeota archaeon]